MRRVPDWERPPLEGWPGALAHRGARLAGDWEAMLANAKAGGDHAVAIWAEGHALLKLGARAQAEAVLVRAAKSAGEEGALRLQTLALLDRAEALRGLGKLGESIEALEAIEGQEATRRGPTRAWALALAAMGRGQVFSGLGDREQQLQCAARAEALAECAEDPELCIQARLLGSRALGRRTDKRGEAERIEVQKRIEAAERWAVDHQDQPLLVSARLQRLNALQVDKEHTKILQELERLEALGTPVSQAARPKEQIMLARIVALLGAGRPVEAAALTVPGPPENYSFIARAHFLRRAVEVERALGLRGRAVAGLQALVQAQKTLEASAPRPDLSIALPLKRWLDKALDDLKHERQLLPEEVTQSEHPEALDEAMVEGLGDNEPLSLRAHYQHLRRDGEAWTNALLGPERGGLESESQADLIQAHVAYRLCFDDLRRVVHLLATVVERELGVLFKAALSQAETTAPSEGSGRYREAIRGGRATLHDLLELTTHLVADVDGARGRASERRRVASVPSKTAAVLRRGLDAMGAGEPLFAALRGLSAEAQGSFRDLRNAFAHGRWTEACRRIEVDAVVLALLVSPPRPLVGLATFGRRWKSQP